MHGGQLHANHSEQRFICPFLVPPPKHISWILIFLYDRSCAHNLRIALNSNFMTVSIQIIKSPTNATYHTAHSIELILLLCLAQALWPASGELTVYAFQAQSLASSDANSLIFDNGLAICRHLALVSVNSHWTEPQ